ncbi:GAF sensor protein, partial [mine drainage metagenome]
NWCGFYLLKPDGDLLVGPIPGQAGLRAHRQRRGVCGTAAVTRRTQRVQDVNDFPGHIACDAASRSEIVVPLQRGDGTLLGVWDVDSPVPARFDAEDEAGMEALCRVFMASID